jgi:hypothetical protein
MSQLMDLNNFIFIEGTAKQYAINKFYDEFVFQKQYYNYQFDSSKDKKFYGMFYNNKTVIPKPNILKSYVNNNGVTHKNLIFVADAFIDLKKHHRNYLLTKKFADNFSKYIDVDVVKSTQNFDSVYLEYIKSLYPIFANFFIPSQNKKITDFNVFIQLLIKFMKVLTKKANFTRSSHIFNKTTPFEINGLTINIAEGNFADIIGKANNFIADANFDTFYDSAKRFGFYVDKNAPWRIVADLESPIMVDYYRRYGIADLDDLFKRFYFNTYEADLEINKNVIVSYWNTYVEQNSYTKLDLVRDGCSKIYSSYFQNEGLTVDNFDRYFNIGWQLRFLLYIKLLEMDIRITQNNFETLYEQLLKINKYVDTKSALTFLNNKIFELMGKQEKLFSSLTQTSEVDRVIAELKLDTSSQNFNF